MLENYYFAKSDKIVRKRRADRSWIYNLIDPVRARAIDQAIGTKVTIPSSHDRGENLLECTDYKNIGIGK